MKKDNGRGIRKPEMNKFQRDLLGHINRIKEHYKADKNASMEKWFTADQVCQILDIYAGMSDASANIVCKRENVSCHIFGGFYGDAFKMRDALLNITAIDLSDLERQEYGNYNNSDIYIFLGNYLGGCLYGINVITTVMALGLIFPKHVKFIIGHTELECTNPSTSCTYKEQCIALYGEAGGNKVFNKLVQAINNLPLICFLNDMLCVSGGPPTNESDFDAEQLKQWKVHLGIKGNEYSINTMKSCALNEVIAHEQIEDKVDSIKQNGRVVWCLDDIAEFCRSKFIKTLVSNHHITWRYERETKAKIMIRILLCNSSPYVAFSIGSQNWDIAYLRVHFENGEMKNFSFEKF